MQEQSAVTLEALGRRAAEEVAGAEAVRRVEVEASADVFDRPVYVFSFLIDQDHAVQRPGIIHIRLSQRLRDALDELGDRHLPEIRLLDRADWTRLRGA